MQRGGTPLEAGGEAMSGGEMRAGTRGSRALAGGIVLALMLVACGTEEPTDPAAEAPEDVADDPAIDDDPIFIGFTVSRTGSMAAFDWEPTQAAMMRIDEINEEGGILGRQVVYEVLDNQSDPALNGTNAVELIDDGADIIFTTSDFDFGAPAAIEAQNNGMFGAFLCASDPKTADRETIGDLVFSLCWGTNNEGAVMAEWAAQSQGWDTVYMLEDISIEYTKSLAWAFTERFEQEGGEIVAADTFNALDPDLDISGQISRLRGHVDDIDAIILPSWIPPAATVAAQIRDAGIDVPILGGTANDGTIVPDIAGDISDYYAVTFGCYAYCADTDKPELDDFAASFEDTYGELPPSTYTMKGYDWITLLAAAIEHAGTTDGPAIRDALQEITPMETLSGSNDFTERWNQPQLRDGTIQVLDQGQWRFVERWVPEQVPDPEGFEG